MVKNLYAMQETGFDSWVRKIPWMRAWLPTPVFFLGEFHELSSLARYSPWDCKESDTTELLTHTHLFILEQKGNTMNKKGYTLNLEKICKNVHSY